MGVGAVKRLSAINFGVVKGYDADLDLYIPGLRADQLCCCKDIYYGILGGKNSGKETGFVLF